MDNGDILVLKGNEIAKLLDGRELDLIDTVGRAYQAHANGASSLPHSSFLHFPDNPRNRIIALPAYLGDEFGVAGIKWVASFPSNIVMNLDRASATVILNSRIQADLKPFSKDQLSARSERPRARPLQRNGYRMAGRNSVWVF